MAYATEANLTARFGAEEVGNVADRDGDGSNDTDAVTNALADASNLIDSFIGERYDLPLSSPPDILEHCCSDIAMYYLGDAADRYDEERKTRFNRWYSWLGKIAAGKVSLTTPELASNSEAVLTNYPNDRIFTRTYMRRF
jgi:phage gp36-like protein